MTKFSFLSCVLALTAMFSVSCFAADEKSPTVVDGTTTIDATQAKALFDEGVVFVDTRKDKDWEAGRIPDAVHIELKKKFNEASLSEEVAKGDKVVFYCNGHSCMRSSKAAMDAVGWGFSNVYYFRDGFPAWKAAGYPSE